MPYDVRFDGVAAPFSGTQSDFPQRALRHFVSKVLPYHPRAGTRIHASVVDDLLAKHTPPKPLARKRLGDRDIVALIHRHWDTVHGRSGQMLRFLRDHLMIACEQNRFKELFLSVKARREAVA